MRGVSLLDWIHLRGRCGGTERFRSSVTSKMTLAKPLRALNAS